MMLNLATGLYREAGQVYSQKLHRIVALLFLPLGALLAYNNFQIKAQLDYCGGQCPADYTLIGIWLIIVPITALALGVYYLDMKPTLTRKRMKSGMNGRTSVEQA